MKETKGARTPSFQYMPTNPVLHALLMEHTLLNHGFSYQEISNMTADQVIIRSLVYGGMEILNQPKGFM